MSARSSLSLRHSLFAPVLLVPVLLSCGGGKPKVTHNTPDPVIESFEAKPATIALGEGTVLIPKFREGIGRITINGQPLPEGAPDVVNSGSEIKVAPPETTTYTLTVTNAQGKSVPSNAIVKVVPPLKDAVIHVAEVVTVGKTLAAYVDEQKDCTYEWTVLQNGVINGDARKREVSVIASSPGDLALTCTLRSSQLDTVTTSVTLSIQVLARPEAPVIQAPSVMDYRESKEARLLTPESGMTYAWEIDGGEILSSTQGTVVTFKAHENADLCMLKCYAINQAGDRSLAGSQETKILPEGPFIAEGLKVAERHFDPRKGTTLTATFRGEGVVNPGNLPIKSGVPLEVHPIHPVLYELTVSKKGESKVQRKAAYPAQILAAGQGHIVARQADGKVMTWGFDNSGQLGDGRVLNSNQDTNKCRVRPGEVKVDAATDLILADVTLVAAGQDYTLALRQDELFAWGWNGYGQCGYGGEDLTSRSKAAPVKSEIPLKDVLMIAGGCAHTLVLDANGVHACGWNDCGQLGQGNKENQNQLHPIANKGLNPKDVVMVSGGGRHSLALDKDGNVWTWGSYENTFGEVDALKNWTKEFPYKFEELKNVVAIASGHMHGLALKSDGTVYAWGDGRNGSLGQGKFAHSTQPVKVDLQDVVAIASHHWHSLAVKSDGSLWGWGYNAGGQINDTLANQSKPVRIEGFSQLAAIVSAVNFNTVLKQDGAVWTWGSNVWGQTGEWLFPGKSCFISVQAGDEIFGRCKIQIKDKAPNGAYCAIRFFAGDKPMEAKGGPMVGEFSQLTYKAPEGATRAQLYVEMSCTGGVEATFSEIHFNVGKDFVEGGNLWNVPVADPSMPANTVVLRTDKNQLKPVQAYALKL